MGKVEVFVMCTERGVWWDWPLTWLTNHRPSVL